MESLEADLDLPMWDKKLKPTEQPEVLRLARNLYLLHYPYERVFLMTGIPVHYWCKFAPKWEKLRVRIDEYQINRIRKKAIGQQVKDFLDKGLHLLNIQLNRWMKTGVDLDPKEFKLISDSIMGLHRVKRLEEGEATDIKQYEAFTPDQLTDYLTAVYTQVKSKHSDLIEYDVERFSDIPTEDYIQTFLDEPKKAIDLVTQQVEKEPSGS